jgi:hypothetical protein
MQANASQEEVVLEGAVPLGTIASRKGGGTIPTLSSNAITQLTKAIVDELKKKPTEVTTPSLTQSKVIEMMGKFDQMMEMAQNMPTRVREQVDESFKEMRQEMEDVKVENDILRLSLGLCIKEAHDVHNLKTIVASKFNSVGDQIEFIKKIKKNLRGDAKTAAVETLVELEQELEDESG